MNLAEDAIRWGALQKPLELDQLVTFIQRRPKAQVVLEIGTCHGGTLWLWCQIAAPDALIVSLDLPGGEFGGGYQMSDIARILGHGKKDQKLELIQGDSHADTALKDVERALDGRQVDLLFIDGDHTYEGVKQDWEMYSPLVSPGGIVVFHDIVKHPEATGCYVEQFWNEIKDDYRHQEFCSPPGDWAGLGVIHIA